MCLIFSGGYVDRIAPIALRVGFPLISVELLCLYASAFRIGTILYKLDQITTHNSLRREKVDLSIVEEELWPRVSTVYLT